MLCCMMWNAVVAFGSKQLKEGTKRCHLNTLCPSERNCLASKQVQGVAARKEWWFPEKRGQFIKLGPSFICACLRLDSSPGFFLFNQPHKQATSQCPCVWHLSCIFRSGIPVSGRRTGNSGP